MSDDTAAPQIGATLTDEGVVVHILIPHEFVGLTVTEDVPEPDAT